MIIEDMLDGMLNYTYKDYELVEQELFTSTALFRYSIDNEKEQFIQAVNQMKELMELD